MNKSEEIFRDIKTKMQTNLLLKVRAGAKKNSIDCVITIDQKEYLKISIAAEPTGGKANKAIIQFLSEKLELPKSALQIKPGKTSSYKLLKISIPVKL